MTRHRVEYLLVGGYAVGYFGHVRATVDLDVWIRRDGENAQRIVEALRDFGFTDADLSRELFETPDRIIRLGVPPLRIEIHTSISGVSFRECHARHVIGNIDGLDVPVVCLADLRCNKMASGRTKDLADLDALPEPPE